MNNVAMRLNMQAVSSYIHQHFVLISKALTATATLAAAATNTVLGMHETHAICSRRRRHNTARRLTMNINYVKSVRLLQGYQVWCWEGVLIRGPQSPLEKREKS